MKGNKVSEYKPHYLKALYFKGKKKRGRKKGGAGGEWGGEGDEKDKEKKDDLALSAN